MLNNLLNKFTSTNDSSYIINVFDYLTTDQKNDVTSRTASIDTTISINSAINMAASRRGGAVFFPDGTYLVKSTIHASINNLNLLGSGIGSTTLLFNNGAYDCIVVEGTVKNPLFQWSISDMTFSFIGKTGGQTIKAYYVSGVNISNIIAIGSWSLFDFYVNNTINIRDIYASNVMGGASAFAISWRAPSDGSYRSDIIFIRNFVSSGEYSGSNGIVWDGLAHTLSVVDCYLLKFNFPLIINNTGRVANNVPYFGSFVNLQIEGAMSNSVQINAGGYFKFVGCSITNASGQPGQLNKDTYAVAIGPDLDASVTRAIKFIGCSIGHSRYSAVFSNARNVEFMQCDFMGGVTTIPDVYAAITIGGDSKDCKVIACNSLLYGFPDPWIAGLIIGTGAMRVINGMNDWDYHTPYKNVMNACDNSIMHNNTCGNSIIHNNTCGNSIIHNNTCGNPIMHNNTKDTKIKCIDVTKNVIRLAYDDILSGIIKFTGNPDGTFIVIIPNDKLIIENIYKLPNKMIDLILSNNTNVTMTVVDESTNIKYCMSFLHIDPQLSKSYKLWCDSSDVGNICVKIAG